MGEFLAVKGRKAPISPSRKPSPKVMADSRRVFVQLARLQPGGAGVARDPPVMAFVLPTDSWGSVVNEFLMASASFPFPPPVSSIYMHI